MPDGDDLDAAVIVGYVIDNPIVAHPHTPERVVAAELPAPRRTRIGYKTVNSRQNAHGCLLGQAHQFPAC